MYTTSNSTCTTSTSSPQSSDDTQSSMGPMESASKGNNDLFDTMIKLSILFAFCMITTLFSSTCYFIGAIIQSENMYSIMNFFITLDTFVNIVCFVLTFSFNRYYYIIICHCCHIQCKNCMLRLNKSNQS